MDPKTKPTATEKKQKTPPAAQAPKSILKKKKMRFAPAVDEADAKAEAKAEEEEVNEEEGPVEGFGSDNDEDDNATIAITDSAEDPAVAEFDERLTTSINTKKNSSKAASVRVRGEPSGGAKASKKRKSSEAGSGKNQKKKPAEAKAAADAEDGDDDEERVCDVDAILANPRNSRVCNIVSSDGQPLTARNACKYAHGCTYTLVQDRAYFPCEVSNSELDQSNDTKYARIDIHNFMHFELASGDKKSNQPAVLSYFIDHDQQLVTCSRPKLMKMFYNDFGRNYERLKKRYLDWVLRNNCDSDAERTEYRVPPIFFTAKDLANKTNRDFPKLDTLEGYVNGKARGASKKRRIDTTSVAATSVAGGDDDDNDVDDDNASSVAPSLARRAKSRKPVARPEAAPAAAAAAPVAAQPEPELQRSRIPLPGIWGAGVPMGSTQTTFDVNAPPLRSLKLHSRAMGPGSHLLLGGFLGNPIARLIQEVGDMCRTELDVVIIADMVNRGRVQVEATRRRLETELGNQPLAAAVAAAATGFQVGPMPLRGAESRDNTDAEEPEEEDDDDAETEEAAADE